MDSVARMRAYFSRHGLGSVRVIESAGLSAEDLQMRLLAAVGKTAGDPLLLLYSGHGDPDGWSAGREAFVPYEWLARLLAVRVRPTVFVNSCCYSASAFRAFRKNGARGQALSVIASASASKRSYSSDRDGLVHRIKKIQRDAICDGHRQE